MIRTAKKIKTNNANVYAFFFCRVDKKEKRIRSNPVCRRRRRCRCRRRRRRRPPPPPPPHHHHHHHSLSLSLSLNFFLPSITLNDIVITD